MNRRPRVLWVNHFAVGPGDGGGTRHFEISRELTRIGWDVTIAASDLNLQSRKYSRRTSPFDRRVITEVIDGVEFLWLYGSPYQRNDWRRLANWMSFAKEVRGLGKSSKWDVVIGSSPHLLAALAAERLAGRMRVPFVLEVRDLWPESLVAAGGTKGPLYYALDGLAQYLYTRSKHIVVLAEGSRAALRRRGVQQDRLSVVSNGVDISAFGPPRTRGGQFRLVYAGAHGPANGLDIVVDCAEILKEKHDIVFRLVGDGPSKIALMERACAKNLTNIEFLEPIPKASIPALLADADAGLMVLRDARLFSYGVSPNKLFDYFAAALPVVCNVAGETADMVMAAQAGEVATPGSANDLAEAICRLANRSREERLAIGSSGRAWVKKERDRPVLAQRLADVLQRVLQ